MIHIDRSRIPEPFVLTDQGLGGKERRAASDFFQKKTEKQRGQSRFPFRVFKDGSVREALEKLFHSKCAYCETRSDPGRPIDVELHRPKDSVMERPDHPGYWWLASRWTNFLTVCIDCDRSRVLGGKGVGKANRFPIRDEKKRAFRPGSEMFEDPLLLDPCTDVPEQHLVFEADGRVVSKTDRGQMSIAILGLNREGLVEARARTASLILQQMRTLEALWGSPPRKSVESEVSYVLQFLRDSTEPAEEYAALKRQLILPFLERLLGRAEVGNLTERWGGTAVLPSKRDRQEAQHAYVEFQKAQSEFSLSDEKGRQTFRSERRVIEKITIRNFKAIKSLELDLAHQASGNSGWLMLLGENGTGKSTVLQAIALTLSGADYLSALAFRREFTPRDFIRRGASKGYVSLKLSGFIAPHELTLTRTKAVCTKPGGSATVIFGKGRPYVKAGKKHSGETQSVVLAYGATRLLPRRETKRYGIEYSRLDNLFDPFLPLFDADRWLSKLDWRQFNTVAIALKDLLALDDSAQLIRENGRVLVRQHGSRSTLKQMSDGYQAVVAMSVDILEVAMRLWPRLQDAEGIVLLDEIGSHLHPTWKMRIVASLRRALPGMQFIATTHDPLCLRGLGEGEVVVMKRDQGRVETVSGLPSPSDFRVDQLLTSEFFGLNTTSDPETEKIFDEYYALLALTALTDDQSARLETLRAQLKDRRHFGNTLRESLMYEAIDRLIAKQRTGARQPIPKLKEETIAELSRIWSDSTPASG